MKNWCGGRRGEREKEKERECVDEREREMVWEGGVKEMDDWDKRVG